MMLGCSIKVTSIRVAKLMTKILKLMVLILIKDGNKDEKSRGHWVIGYHPIEEAMVFTVSMTIDTDIIIIVIDMASIEICG